MFSCLEPSAVDVVPACFVWNELLVQVIQTSHQPIPLDLWIVFARSRRGIPKFQGTPVTAYQMS